MATPVHQPEFVADSVPSVTPAEDEVAALSSSKALARFEFESGRGNEGTKVLMVEWEDEAASTSNWKIEWPGKTTVLSAKDGADGSLHRVYFLLAPGASVPARVTLSQEGKTIQTNPLPAIFPPELGVTATTAGKKGVLHTVWAKQRLSVLQKEIEAEMNQNGEGIGLEMALQEKQWIEENFGVTTRVAEAIPLSPTSPRSPLSGGGRLAEKLKGLKLGTSPSELAEQGTRPANPLSPNLGDVAVSSFSAFHGTAPRPQRGISLNTPSQLNNRLNASRPATRLNSLDAIASGQVTNNEDPEVEDGLFAVKMSPRSPEMTRSPFSFAPSDTAPWKDNE